MRVTTTTIDTPTVLNIGEGPYGPDYVEREVEKAHGVRLGADQEDPDEPPKRGPGCGWLTLPLTLIAAALLRSLS